MRETARPGAFARTFVRTCRVADDVVVGDDGGRQVRIAGREPQVAR